jgi:hypothetical protein
MKQSFTFHAYQFQELVKKILKFDNASLLQEETIQHSIENIIIKLDLNNILIFDSAKIEVTEKGYANNIHFTVRNKDLNNPQPFFKALEYFDLEFVNQNYESFNNQNIIEDSNLVKYFRFEGPTFAIMAENFNLGLIDCESSRGIKSCVNEILMENNFDEYFTVVDAKYSFEDLSFGLKYDSNLSKDLYLEKIKSITKILNIK